MNAVELKLSNREIQVCNLLIIGSSTTDIAKILNLKCNTVSTIKKSIFKKTNTINLIELYELYKQA
jgi:DNA-binding NarL/FixJ family response regulator